MPVPSNEALKLCEFSSHEVNGNDVSLSIKSPQQDPPSSNVYKRPHLEHQSLLNVGGRDLNSHLTLMVARSLRAML